MRRSRRGVLGAILLSLALLASACGSGEDDQSGSGDSSSGGGDKGEITVGAVAFAENQIVAEMYGLVLENAGYTVQRQTDLESREIVYPALKSDEIQLAPEYLSSLLLYLDPEAEASPDSAANVELLEPLVSKDGLQLLEPSDANDQNAFVTTQEVADEFGLSAVSDLADVAGDLTLAGPPECPKRPFCIPGLEEVYGVTFGSFKPLDGTATVAALESGQVDVGLLFSTQSVIEAKDFVLLEDDMNLQAAESITPLISEGAVDDEATQLLNDVSAALTTENITQLNGRVEIDQEDPATVAEDFLTEEGLL